MLVYAAMAACSGSGAKTSGAGQAGHADAQGGENAVAVGGYPNSASGAPGASEAGLGGLLDPVPPAHGQEAGSGPGVASALTYTEVSADCDQLIKISGTNYPAAIIDIDPPSPVVAAMTVHMMAQTNTFEVGWVQAGPGGIIRQDGSQVAVQCTKVADSVTFYVPVF